MDNLNALAEQYLSSMKDNKLRGKARKALSRKMTINGTNPMSRADHAVRLYNDGYKVVHLADSVRLVATNETFFTQSDVTKTLCDFVSFLREDKT